MSPSDVSRRTDMVPAVKRGRPPRAATAVQEAIQNSPGRPSKRSDERGKKGGKISGSGYDDRADKGATIG